MVRGHQSWALLARILLAERPLSRRQLSAELFPSAEDPLGALRWCLAGCRRALGSAGVLVGDPVVAGLPAATRLDVADVESGTFDIERAGELLEGIDPRCSPELDMWLLVSRQRFGGLIDALVRAEVLGSLSAGATNRALPLAELGVRRAVFDEGAHVLLVKSLVAAGRYEAAREHVDDTEALFRRELGIEPTAALRSAGRRRLADAPPGVPPRAVATSLLESGRAALATGTIEAGLECLRRAADGATAGDEHLEADCLFELGAALVHAVRSHDDEGAVLLQHSADLAASQGDHRLAADAHRELGYIDSLAGRRAAASITFRTPGGSLVTTSSCWRGSAACTLSTSPTGVVTTKRSPSTAPPSSGPRQARTTDVSPGRSGSGHGCNCESVISIGRRTGCSDPSPSSPTPGGSRSGRGRSP